MDKLEIPPEIVHCIGELLDNLSLATSVRVCKSWNSALIPILYRTIDSSRSQPSREVLARNAHHIRHFTYCPEECGYALYIYATFTGCTNLKELDLVFRGDDSNESHLLALMLVVLNRNLLKLRIHQDFILDHPCFWGQALLLCSRSLQVLSLVNVELSAQETSLLLCLGLTLQELHIEEGISNWSGSFVETPQFPGLKRLVFNNALSSTSQELEWIKQCPNLEALDWSSDRERDDLDRAAFKNLGDHRWQNLQRIDIWENTALSDSDIALLLASCGALKGFWINNSNFWYQSLSALERHFGTLEKVKMRCNGGVQFWMYHWIMCCCPNLKMLSCDGFATSQFVESSRAEQVRALQSLHGDMLDLGRMQTEVDDGENAETLETLLERFVAVQDSIFAQPWVCLDLEQLQGTFTIPADADNDWDQAAFRQISNLTKLKVLDVRRGLSVMSVGKTRGLRLDLKSGLGSLAPLKYLEQLLFDDIKQHLEREDVQWILDQWPKLTEMSLNFNTNRRANRELQSMVLASRGIEMGSESDTSSDESDCSSGNSEEDSEDENVEDDENEDD